MEIKLQNGTAPNDLLKTLTGGYKRPTSSSLPAWAFGMWGSFSTGVIDQMRTDAQVDLVLSYKTAPIHMAEFDYQASGQDVLEFGKTNLTRFWSKSLSTALEAVPYGYVGSEALYRTDDHTDPSKTPLVQFDALRALHQRDTRPWTHGGKLQFVRVKGVQEEGGRASAQAVDLPGATKDRPAKGFWFVHGKQFNQWYGRPGVMSSWLPWQMKTMPDGGIQILHLWYYKHAFSGMIVRGPNESYSDSPDGRLSYARDDGQEMADKVKVGANIFLPSTRDAGGNYLWNIESYGKIEGDPTVLTGYLDWLDKQIQRGILVPDEVITHEGNTGGYSRSQVAASAFLIAAESMLNQVLEAFMDQVLNPLVRMNFGAQAWLKVKPKPLIPPEQQQGGQGGGQQGQNPFAGLMGGGGEEAKPAQQAQALSMARAMDEFQDIVNFYGAVRGEARGLRRRRVA